LRILPILNAAPSGGGLLVGGRSILCCRGTAGKLAVLRHHALLHRWQAPKRSLATGDKNRQKGLLKKAKAFAVCAEKLGGSALLGTVRLMNAATHSADSMAQLGEDKGPSEGKVRTKLRGES